jgi:hypothetical protein
MSNTSFSETHPVGANNIGYEGKPVSANNLFADLEALRLSPEAAAVAGRARFCLTSRYESLTVTSSLEPNRTPRRCGSARGYS